jgi:ABC-type multidrug transport system fused ATPase/permease subunit
MNDRRSYYQERLPGLHKDLADIHRKMTRISFGRLITFSAIIAMIFLYSKTGPVLFYSISVFLACIFAFLVKRHVGVSALKKHVEQLIIIHDREINILSYRFDREDPGSDFLDIHHPYSYDLDIFEEGSLFQFVNRTVMKKGREKLANWFREPCPDIGVIKSRQEALKELAEKDIFRLDFRATGETSVDNTDDLQEVTDWFNEPSVMGVSWFYRIARIAFPLASLVCLVLTLFQGEYYRLLIMIFLLQLMITGIRLRTTNRIHGIVSKRLQTFKKLHRLIVLTGEEKFRTGYMKNLTADFYNSGISARSAIRQLSRLVSAFDNRLNVLAGLLLNGFILWDIQCILRLEKWKSRYKDHFSLWVDGMAETDALISLATFHFNFPQYCFPEFTDRGMIQGVALGHPLIADDQRVCNDFSIPSEGTIVMITGANMAGKSTFLRTVGVNIVLAMSGAPVCATRFALKPADLYTSMRTSDSLLHHESYFYAELKRIKTIVDELSRGRKMLIMLDEILKGTNSEDKHRGSQAVLKRIFALGGTAIIATHDLELAKDEPLYKGRMINKCFEIEIKGADISFDYKLRDGITQKMNASLLMRQMGIV